MHSSTVGMCCLHAAAGTYLGQGTPAGPVRFGGASTLKGSTVRSTPSLSLRAVHLQLQGELVLFLQGWLLPASAGRACLMRALKHLSLPAPASPAGTLHCAAGRRWCRSSSSIPNSPSSRSRCRLWTPRASAGCCRPRWRCSSLCCSQVGCFASQLVLPGTAQAAPEARHASPVHRWAAACDGHRSLGQFEGC